MKDIIEIIENGDPFDNKDKIELGKMMDEFKGTKVYKVLKALNTRTLKELIGMNRMQGESSESRLGHCQGILTGFEASIDLMIAEGLGAMDMEKAEKRLKKEEKELFPEQEELGNADSGGGM